MKYDDLVKRLKSECILPYATIQLIRESADAIEELSQVADAIPHVCECCIGCEVESGSCDDAFVLSPKRAKEYLSKPKWIPVTERLPESVCKSYLCLTDTGYHCEVRWTNNVYGLFKSGNKWGWSIVDVPQYCKVTHWMPLPEPPKEG